MFKIKLNQMHFYTYIGVFPEEKKLGQNVVIDLEVTINTAVSRDALDETLSYATFYEVVAAYMKQTHADLIETLAFDITQQIKAVNPDKITKVKINVKKMQVPIDGILDSAEIELEV